VVDVGARSGDAPVVLAARAPAGLAVCVLGCSHPTERYVLTGRSSSPTSLTLGILVARPTFVAAVSMFVGGRRSIASACAYERRA
jgi:hypothetical protein